MKKTLTITVSFILCIGLLLGAIAVFSTNMLKGEASIIKTVEIEDNFDAAEIDFAWSMGEETQHVSSDSVLRFKSTALWNNSVNLQAVELKGDCTISFNVSLAMGNAWIGLLFGVKSQAGEMRFADTALILQDVVTFQYKNKGNEVGDATSEYKNLANGMSIARSGVAALKIDLVLDTAANDGTYKALLSYKDATSSGDYTACLQEFKGIVIGPYFGIACMDGSPFVLDITNFKITNADNTVLFEDDFRSGSISYPNAVNDNANWKISGGYGSSKVFCGELKTIGFNEKDNATLLSNVALLADPDSKRAFTISYDTFITTIAENGMFGAGFNLSDTTQALDKNVFVGLKRRANDYIFVKSVAGVVTEGAIIVANLIEKGAKISELMTVEGYSDRRVTVSIAGISHTFSDVAFDGAFAIGVTDAGTASKVEIDNFYLASYIFKTSDAPDQAVNFQGVRTWEEMGDTYRELYLNEKVWLKSGNGVSLGEYGDNCIDFTSARENVLFGLRRQQYSDVIIRFNVRSTAAGTALEDYCGIGITVGRENALSPYQDGNSMFIGSYQGATWIRGTNISDYASNGANIYKDTTTWYNVMFVVSDNSIFLYYKADKEPMSEMGKLRAKLENINTHGYVAIACSTENNKANNFSLTDVSFTNLEV